MEGGDSTVGPAVIEGAGDDVGEQRADLEDFLALLVVGTALIVGAFENEGMLVGPEEVLGPAEILGAPVGDGEVEGPMVLLLPLPPLPLPLFVGMAVLVGAYEKEGSPVGPVLGSEEGTIDVEGTVLGAPLTEGCNDTEGALEGERERDGAGDSDGAGDDVGAPFLDFFDDLHEVDFSDFPFLDFDFQTQSFAPDGAGETVGSFPALPLPIRFQA
jgi:hypothetical protein